MGIDQPKAAIEGAPGEHLSPCQAANIIRWRQSRGYKIPGYLTSIVAQAHNPALITESERQMAPTVAVAIVPGRAEQVTVAAVVPPIFSIPTSAYEVTPNEE